MEFTDFHNDREMTEEDLWDKLEGECLDQEEEMHGLCDWQLAREIEAAIDDGESKEKIFYMLSHDVNDGAWSMLCYEDQVKINNLLDDSWEEEYQAVIGLESTFNWYGKVFFPRPPEKLRLQELHRRHHFVGKKYQARGNRPGENAEMRDWNAPKFRMIEKFVDKILVAELLDNEPIDTSPRILAGHVYTFGFERPVINIPRTKVAPFPKNRKVELLENPIRAKSDDGKKYDYRTRRCAPMTSKSSPFNNIKEV